MSEERTSVHTISELLGKAAKKERTAFLIVLNSKNAALIGKMTRVDEAEVTLGRSAECTLQTDDDGVSRKHCKVMVGQNNQYQVMDLGSTNGTYLNGAKVTVGQLQDGDKIQIGSNTVVKFSLQDQLEEQYQKNIYEQATRDGLTKIFNKKYFLDTIRKEFAFCLRHRVPLALVMFDVDHFKRVNDTFGHQAGDYVLVRLAQRVGETVRAEDLFARYGGEEFALLLRETDAERAVRCAERCRRAAEVTEFVFNGTPIPVTISLGVTTIFDTDFANPEDMIESADKYLYRAKRGGRNRVDAKSISGA